MCQHGKEVKVRVQIPADLSHTEQTFWKLVPIDGCISSLVRALQEGGIMMRGSCCGHGKAKGHIDLQDGRILIIEQDGEKWLAEQ